MLTAWLKAHCDEHRSPENQVDVLFPLTLGDEELYALGDLLGKPEEPGKLAFDHDKVEQLYLGFKHFRCQGEANPDIFNDFVR